MKQLSPVFVKEMISLSRRRRYYFTRALFLGVLLVAIWTGWRQSLLYMQGRDFTDLSYLGRSLFEAFSTTQFAFVILLMPVLTAPVIAAEKERDTLSLLLMTNLGHRNILVDKLLSRIALVSLLLLSCLPVFLALLAFRGIEPGEILSVYVATFAAILLCCGVGLLVSTHSTTVRGALMGTYLALAGCAVGLPLLFGCCAFPFGELFYFLGGGTTAGNFGAICIVFLIVSILVFYFCVKRCVSILPRIAGTTRESWWKHESERLRKTLRNTNFFRRTILRADVPIKRNPMFWREYNKRICSSRIFLFFWCYTLSFLLYGFYLYWSANIDFAMAVSTLHLSTLGVYTVILSATTFAGEKEGRSFNLLLCTPQTGFSFVMSRFLGVLRSVSVFAIVPLLLPFLGLIPVFRYDGWLWLDGLLCLAVTIAVFLPAVIIIGLFFSAGCRRAGNATAWTFVTVLAWILSPVLLEFLTAGTAVSTSNSMQMIVTTLKCLSPTGWFWDIFSGPLPHMPISPALPILACVLMFFALVRRFDRAVGRM